ncbi:hypothetical protein JZ751_007332, partial [Albula glossodonta]
MKYLRPKIFGFSWKNCGKPDDPAVMKTLDLSPDPIGIPGDVTASAAGSTSVKLAAPLAVNVTLEKEVAGFWVKIPCLEEIGSCHYPDGCQLLDMSDFYLPNVDLPYWLTNGNYRVEGVLGSQGQELGCLK